MNKKKFKNVFSKTFVLALAAIAAQSINVDAASVRETAGQEIDNGAYLIGITRFTNDVALTADRVLTAGQNDLFFKGINAYNKPVVYQYRGGNWIKYDEENNSSLVAPEDVLALGLNAQDIYYINNKEKVLEVAYNRNVAPGTTLSFTTDAVGKAITYENGVMYVPATTKKIEVKARDGQGAEVLLETLSKTAVTEAGSFDYKTSESNYYGAVAADNIFTKDADVAVNGETITINGTVNWSNGLVKHGVDYKPADATVSGHRIGVKITAPNGTSLDPSNLANIKVSIDGDDEHPVSWTEANTGKDSSFWFTPIVEAGKTYTLKVVWDEAKGITQTFTIKVEAELAAMPAGTLKGETIYAVDDKGELTDQVTLSATADDTKLLTFSGSQIAWDGNVTVKVTPDSYYSTNSQFTGANVSAYYSRPDKDVDGYDIVTKDYLFKDVMVTADTKTKVLTINNLRFMDTAIERKITVRIDWDKDYYQEFDVVLADETPFAFPQVRLEEVKTLVGYAGSEKAYNTYEVKDGKVTISNTQILWDNGNRVKAVVKPSTLANNSSLKDKDKLSTYEDEELSRLTVRVDGEVIGTKDKDGKFTATTLADNMPLDILVKSGNETHKVEILWDGSRVVETYDIVLSGASLATAQTGSYSLNGQTYASELTNGTIYVYMSTFHNVLDDKGAVIDQERDSIPFVYEVNANAVVMSFNNSAYNNIAKKVEIDGKEAVTTAGGYYIPVYKNAVTTVKVYWDDVNVQEFQVAPHATNGLFATANKGVISKDGAEDNAKNTTSLVYSGDINWSKAGSTTISVKDEEKPSYVLDGLKITAPKDVTVTEPKVTINGGKYSDDETKENFATIQVTKTEADGKTSITLDPVVTTSNDMFTIKVDWNGAFVETYTVKLSGATLKAPYGTLAPKDTSDKTPLNNYNGVIAYNKDANGYVLKTTLTPAAGYESETVAKIEIDDARTTLDSKGEKVLTVVENTFDADVHFTNERRKATLTVTYEKGNKQTFTIDATEATIPAVVLNTNVTEKEGVYSITAKVGDNLGTIASRVLPNTAVLYVDQVDASADGKNVAVLEKNSQGAYIAKAVGTSTLTFNVNSGNQNDARDNIGKDVVVNVYIVNEEVSVKSSAAFDGDKILNITSNVTGGTGAYEVTVDVLELKEGKYVETNISGTATRNASGQYITTITAANMDKLPKKIKLVITAKSSDATGNNAALENQTAIEYIELPSAVRYTVTFDANGGSYVNPIIVDAGMPGKAATVGKLVTPTREDKKTPNGNTIKYEFDGWYATDAFDEEGNLKAGQTAIDENTEVTANASYKANWVITRFNAEGQKIDESGNPII